VLGCTEYELAAGLIGAALPGATLFRSAAAVAAQALRRARAGGADAGPDGTPPLTGTPPRTGTLRVLLSGRLASLPDAALRYPEGRLLAGLPADRRPPADRPPADRPPAGDRPAPSVPA
jgi:glutamate racemase